MDYTDTIKSDIENIKLGIRFHVFTPEELIAQKMQQIDEMPASERQAYLDALEASGDTLLQLAAARYDFDQRRTEGQAA